MNVVPRSDVNHGKHTRTMRKLTTFTHFRSNVRPFTPSGSNIYDASNRFSPTHFHTLCQSDILSTSAKPQKNSHQSCIHHLAYPIKLTSLGSISNGILNVLLCTPISVVMFKMQMMISLPYQLHQLFMYQVTTGGFCF